MADTAFTDLGSARSRLTNEGTHREAFEARDWFNLWFAGVVWGASFIFIRAGIDNFHPGVVTFGRIAIGALTLGFFRQARATRIDRGDWPRIVLVSITWLAFPMTLFPIAQKSISTGLAGMLNGSIPLFAALVSSFALRRLPGRWQQFGLVVGALGIVILGIPALGDGASSARGVVLIVVACVSYGIAVTVNVPLAQKYGSIATFWRCQLVASVLTFPMALVGFGKSTWDATSAFALLVLGAFGTALAFLAMINLSKRVGSTRSAALTYLEAIIAFALGIVIQHERLRLLEVIGCIILFFGAWLVSRADRIAAPL